MSAPLSFSFVSFLFLLLIYISSPSIVRAEEDHEHDDEHHDDHPSHNATFSFEWHGLTEWQSSESLWWTASKKDGQYAASSMIIAVLPLSSIDIGASSLSTASESLLKEVLENAEHQAIDLLADHDDGNDCMNITVRDIIVPSNTSCYRLLFNNQQFMSTFQITGAEGGGVGDVVALAVFTEHLPTEFENGLHYLLNSDGAEKVIILDSSVVSVVSSSKPSKSERVRNTMLATLASVALIILVAPVAVIVQKYSTPILRSVTLAFSSGAIFATAVFMTALEASHLIETKYSNESAVSALWGIMVIAGFLCNPFAEVMLNFFGIDVHNHAENDHGHHHHSPHPVGDSSFPTDIDIEKAQLSNNSIELVSAKSNEANGSLSKNAIQDESIGQHRASEPINWRLVRAVVVGDFLHNFVDGIFIAASFSKCSSGLAWTITGATIAHEIAQEIGDFILLTVVAKLRPHWALLVNFLSALSVMIGGAVFLANDNLSDYSIGLCLAFACGVYIYTAIVEGSGWLASDKSPIIRFSSMISFIIGCTAIGLVLLNHEHCDEEGAAAGGEHGHSH